MKWLGASSEMLGSLMLVIEAVSSLVTSLQMSETLHATRLGDSLTGEGYLPSLTPANQPDRLIEVWLSTVLSGHNKRSVGGCSGAARKEFAI